MGVVVRRELFRALLIAFLTSRLCVDLRQELDELRLLAQRLQLRVVLPPRGVGEAGGARVLQRPDRLADDLLAPLLVLQQRDAPGQFARQQVQLPRVTGPELLPLHRRRDRLAGGPALALRRPQGSEVVAQADAPASPKGGFLARLPLVPDGLGEGRLALAGLAQPQE